MHAVCVRVMSSVVIYGPVMPLFGVFLTGATGLAVILLIELVLAYLVWGTYRLHMAAWWGMRAARDRRSLEYGDDLHANDLMAMYEKMGMPPEQLEMMRKVPALARVG